MFVKSDNPNSVYNFIDLFSGAGGLSEGFMQAGFNPIAHVEMNENASKTLETRSVFHALKKDGNLDAYYLYQRGELSREELFKKVPKEAYTTVINKEMSQNTLTGIFKRVDSILKADGVNHVDVVIGGPPCQAFSLVGRAQTTHMRIPMENDPRNYLFKMYVRFLRKYQPKMFVFENVQGIKTAKDGRLFPEIQECLRKAGYEIDCHVQNAQDFGVLQNRKRMIIVGWRKDTHYHYPNFGIIKPNAIVNDLLVDLAPVQRGGNNNIYSLDYEHCSDYLKWSGIRTPEDIVTNHEARNNTVRDIEIYRRVIEAWSHLDENGNPAHQRLHYNELPDDLKTHRNQTSFVDRFKVVEGDMPYCHTILAHLSKDGHYFIHPDINQCRSITVREAARLQSFPDSYFFEGNRTSQFVQIGNAVPPLMARGIAEKIRAQLEENE